VTNITFVFETSPNTKSKEKKIRGHGILCPPRLKSGGTRHPCPPPNCAHGVEDASFQSPLVGPCIHTHTEL